LVFGVAALTFNILAGVLGWAVTDAFKPKSKASGHREVHRGSGGDPPIIPPSNSECTQKCPAESLWSQNNVASVRGIVTSAELCAVLLEAKAQFALATGLKLSAADKAELSSQIRG
jgi:hypothetical protein